MSDDSDIENKTGQRRKRPLNPATPSESSDSGNSLVTSKRSRKQLVVKSDDESSDSENEEIIAVRPGLKRKTPKIQSDYETGESNNENEDLLTDTSESSSGDENDSNGQAASGKKNLECLVCESSSDSDGQSEKCPICLAKFVDQEIGTPEACDHFFCATCIQEWAKNVNTCPVDRQPFTLILVRQQLDGKVFRQIPVNVPTVSIEVPEDATFCEVCGLSDREDRMLLCDACDHGYHMECLNPPLDHVPIDEWYCPECAPRRATMRRSAGISRGVHREEEPASEGNEIQTRDRPRPRMVPRTRHSERVRTTLRNRRVNIAPSNNQPITSSGVDSMEGESNPLRRRTTQRRNRVKKRQSRFRIKTIVTDDGVIEVVLKRKRRKKYRKRKNRTVRSAPRSVKGRLANKLGMCKPRVTNQMIPETLNRQELISAPINHQRHQAGIPTLDIFGRRDQLDYFSGTDDENGMESLEGGVGFMVRARVSRTNDHLINRKKAATILSSKSIRKPLKVETFTSPPTTNLLDSILNSQTLWHSKKMEIKSKSDGSVRVIIPKGSKTEIFKEDKIDVRNTVAPVVQTPMFPGGRGDTGTYKQDYSNKGGVGNTQSANRSGSEQTCTESSSFQSSSSGGGASYSKYESSVGPSPLRGVAPIRFRMNIPPRRPNIHSYPTDNIPPPPPLRLRLPVAEVSFPPTNSPEASPTKEEEEIDIYSDIEQETNANENELEEKSFGVMEPPPEPPFLMTMEPPPEPPAILMNINDDASDDEPSGLVIDDPLQNETYDPCAINSDDSSTDNAPLSKPPEVPVALKTPDLVADYSSNSCPNMETPPYNPELPTYLNTPIIGPLPRPASHKTSEAEESDDECPNFSMYSAASMNLAHRGLTLPIPNLDIPIPPTIEEDPNVKENFDDIPLPDSDSPKSNVKYDSLDIPIPEELGNEDITECDKKLTVHASNHNKNSKNFVSTQKSTTLNDQIEELEKQSLQSDEDTEEHDQVESDDDDDDDDGGEADDDSDDQSVQEEPEKNIKSKIVKTKGSSEAGEDECSTQGDVLDLAIESEANLENNIPHDDSEEQHRIDLVKSPPELDEISEKVIDSGDKSDGLVDITDEEMSVYDGQDNGTDFEKLNEQVIEEMQHRKNESKPLDSDDDNSLVGGATSAVSAGTLNNSDNIQPPTLPGLEGLETETISESEDVNFDELPMEGNEQHEILISDEDLISSRKKRKKKYRKISHTEDGKGNEPLEFEEGEIIEDKPKQVLKKDKKSKATPDNEVKTDDIVEINKQKTAFVEKEPVEKKSKKKKDKSSTTKDKNDKNKELKEKLLKPGEIDENISWKKLSRSNKERNYRDGKERDEKDKDRENKDEVLSKKEKRNKERRKELERYNVRRLISEKPKRPKKDEFGRDISPSKSGSSLSPYRPPRYRSPLRTRNRSRTRSKSWKSRSRSRGRRRQNRSRERLKSHERSRRSHSRERSRKRSRSRDKIKSRERRKTPDQDNTIKKARTSNRSPSWTRKKSRSPNSRRRSASYSRSWTPSWSKSSVSRSRSRGRRKSRSVSRTKSRSWTREQNVASLRRAQKKNPPKNLTVIVTNKEALKKKEKRKPSKKKDDRRKKKRGQSPVPSKEVFTSGDNILVSVNFKNANKNPELIPASTPLLRESSKRKRDDTDSSAKKKKLNSSSKKSPGVKKSNRLAKINEVARNAKPVAIIDLDLSPFREQTPSPKEVIVLSDSGDEGDKQHSEVQDEINRLGHSAITQSMLSLSSIDHGQKNSLSQPESPLSSSFLLNSSGPKTPPEPHIKFSISTKPSQIRLLTNPLMETEEEMQDENIENDEDEILHKGPNTPPEPPPDLNTPASPPTTPYDPFDPTKSRSPSPQPRNNEIGQLNTTREDKLENLQNDDNDHQRLAELRTSTPPNEPDDLKKTPEITKVHSTPKSDPNNTDTSPKVSPPIGISESNKIGEDTLMKPVPKLLAGTNKVDVTIVHKSPEKLTSVVSQQVKNSNQTPKQTSQPLKTTTPNKHQTPKSNAKHQLFSSSLLKQVPILGTLSLLSGAPTYTPSVGLNSNNKMSSRLHQNGDPSDDMDIDPSSPYSPGSSEGDDLFEPPIATPPRSSSKPAAKTKPSSGNKFDSLFGTSPAKPKHGKHTSKTTKKGSSKLKSKGNKKEEVKVKLDEDQLKILEDMPSSAVEMQVKDKFLKKLNRQERVVEEVKLVLKPHYAKKHINKEDYKEILRRAVPKICHNKSGEINPIKIQYLIEAYVKKFRYAKKKASGAVSAPVQMKPKPQKTLWS